MSYLIAEANQAFWVGVGALFLGAVVALFVLIIRAILNPIFDLIERGCFLAAKAWRNR